MPDPSVQPPEGLRKILVRALNSDEWLQRHIGIAAHAEDVADAVLAALFDACEVREQWGVRYTFFGGKHEDRFVYRDRADAEEQLVQTRECIEEAHPNGRLYGATVELIRSCQVASPPEPVSQCLSAKDSED